MNANGQIHRRMTLNLRLYWKQVHIRSVGPVNVNWQYVSDQRQTVLLASSSMNRLE
jgi:hypothetical protein